MVKDHHRRAATRPDLSWSWRSFSLRVWLPRLRSRGPPGWDEGSGVEAGRSLNGRSAIGDHRSEIPAARARSSKQTGHSIPPSPTTRRRHNSSGAHQTSTPYRRRQSSHRSPSPWSFPFTSIRPTPMLPTSAFRRARWADDRRSRATPNRIRPHIAVHPAPLQRFPRIASSTCHRRWCVTMF
jgi:hypothetical protein